MKIVHAASEMFPYVKTGGLADVCGSLFKSLAGVGHEVSFFLPGYRKIIESKEFESAKLKVVLQVELGEQFLRGEVWAISLGKRQTLYIIRRDEYFDRSNLYGTRERDYDDNDARFIYFSKAVVQAMRLLDIKADILHCHDWQTGLLPLFLRMAEQETGMTLALKTFFSIHNLAFQGLYPRSSFKLTNLPEEFNAIDGLEFYEQISMIKGGIFFADKIMTVSPNYAREILTPRFGCGLEGALKVREEDLVGIANGIDTEVWNPRKDPYLLNHYGANDLSGKALCQEALLNKVGLKKGEGPVYGLVARLTEQKGVDLLLKRMNFFVKNDCRIVLLGKGDPTYEKALRRWAKSHPEHVAVCIVLDEEMSHLVEAGSDYFIMPSVFEPCGLNQMYSQRYGTLPLVSGVGGLKDTVVDIVSDPKEGTGIVFEPNEEAYAQALEDSLSLYNDQKAFLHAIKRAMKRDFSWKRVTAEYEALYQDCV
ncbi:glycogen synthase GlgA [Pelagicoccus mobilis]|uniref:Glycogen synthase n=1 Tax=Pelagicoccus mobilis TaxID=415221 RepID=A0A934S0Q0_9BACT|nr:glycogen synthase GlgA [Pelagicoccus mobilis]MBK1879778.1 glycogen synthase GlgA [Pelagicoccus mobilis]